jgi:hypothetical protein
MGTHGAASKQVVELRNIPLGGCYRWLHPSAGRRHLGDVLTIHSRVGDQAWHRCAPSRGPTEHRSPSLLADFVLMLRTRSWSVSSR